VKPALFLLAALSLWGQSGALSPAAEFNLNANLKHRPSRTALPFLAANPKGLTLVTVEEDCVSLASADLAGRILHARSDLASVRAQIYEALPLPDGSVWIVARGPYQLLTKGFGGFVPNAGPSAGDDFQELDRYDPAGKAISSVRLLSRTDAEVPIAAAGDVLVVRAALRGAEGFPANEATVRFGTVDSGRFRQTAEVPLPPPPHSAIAVLTARGDLWLIGKLTGNVEVVDPKTGGVAVLPTGTPHPVVAAAADPDSLYVLAADTVLKMDLAGKRLATYRLQFGRGFQPAALAVTGDALYLADRAGRTECFRIH